MIAMGGRRPPWSVGASLKFPLDCSIANYYSRLCSFWYKKKKWVITHLERVITRQREKINRFGNCSMAWKWIHLSLESRMVSWYKNKIELAGVSNCMRQCLNFLVLNVHIPAYLGSRGKPFFWNFVYENIILHVQSIVYEFVYMNSYSFLYTNAYIQIRLYKFVHTKSYKKWIYILN